jgi:RNA polymerase sigma-70 factor, ECF subfamily
MQTLEQSPSIEMLFKFHNKDVMLAIANVAFKFKIDNSDLVNEVNYRIANAINNKNGAEFHTKSDFMSWIYRIATNCAISLYRKTSRVEVVSYDNDGIEKDHIAEMEDKSYPDQRDMRLLLQEIRQHVMSVFGQIPYYIEVFDFIFHEDLQYDQIADKMSMPINSIKTVIHRLRKEIKSRFHCRYSLLVTKK